MSERIPFNHPFAAPASRRYLLEALDRGRLSGDGDFTARCSAELQSILGAPRVLLTTSCTHALEMAALLLEVGPGDEVVVPSFTFVSTINAFVLRGAVPRFVDIRPDTLNLDERQVPAAMSPRTRAIVPVHYAGVSCEMESLLAVAAETGVPIVEDNAHGLLGSYLGRPLGTFGTFATQSFHETKNLTCGEGGALVINDAAYIARAEIIREKGTNRSRFFRGEVDKYSWVDLGSSYLPSELLAAVLLGQLESREHIQETRRKIWERYQRELRSWAHGAGVRLPHVPEGCGQAWHMYYLLLPSPDSRQGMIAHLRDLGIHAVFHYLPLHLSEMGRRYGGRPGQCPVTEEVSDRLLRLPFFCDLSESDQERVVEGILSFTP